MDVLTIDDIKNIFSGISNVMQQKEAELCEMDAQMGDGDLGITMRKGWISAAETARDSTETDLGKVFVKCGLKMASTVPSTMGTLMASGLMAGGKAVAGKNNMDIHGLSDFFQAFCDGISTRGKSQPGDRTVLDSLWPAAEESARQTKFSESSMADILRAAGEGLESTKNMKPKFGKAVVFSEKALGKIDQGAFVGFLIIKSICEYVKGLRG
jgi:dihydroxyacetone kinase-like protein